MYSEAEKAHLLKAVSAFKRRIIVISPEFEILAVNCLNGIEKTEDVIGKACHEVFYDRSLPCDSCAAKEVMETGKPALTAKPVDRVELGTLPCYFSYPIHENGRIASLVSMDFDLPSTGQLEEKMNQSHALLRNLIRSAVDGVIAADRKGNIIMFNKAASELTGYSEEEVLKGENIRDVYPEGVAYEVMAKLRSAEYGGEGKLKAYHVNVLSKDGEKIPISLNASIVYENGKETATIGFFHDLREILKMKKELEQTQLQLLQAEKMASLGKLAAGVAHQLNNPLGGITLFAKLMLEEYDLSDEIKDDLNRILGDAERCRDTVKELLEFTRQTRHLMRPHDINEAISRTLFLLENQSLFQNVDIRKELASKLPPVEADIQQLNHLFMNIILNAVQAMKGKGILSVKSRLKADRERVCIEISDTGPGIPEDNLPRIFDPFFTTKDEGEGTGLGLSLAYGIVENHGGDIRAESTVGDGTTFIINLPLSVKSDKGNGNGE